MDRNGPDQQKDDDKDKDNHSNKDNPGDLWDTDYNSDKGEPEFMMTIKSETGQCLQFLRCWADDQSCSE